MEASESLSCENNNISLFSALPESSNINCFWIGLLGFLVVLGLRAWCLGHLYLGLWLLLQMLLVVTVPVFFYVFAEGAVWSPSTFFLLSDCWLVVLQVWVLSVWGILNGCVCVIAIVIIRRDQPVFS